MGVLLWKRRLQETQVQSKKSAPISKSETVEEKTSEKKYTKSEITFMKVAKLKQLAKENGLTDAEEKTGSELKEYLINKFGL